ncbi:MAG: glutamine synthetase family protein [Pseudomonadota bacterium]
MPDKNDKNRGTENSALLMLGWTDLVGLVRVRGVPIDARDVTIARGLGWAAAGHAMTPFGGIAPNPWGATAEVQQIPIPETEVAIVNASQEPIRLILTRSETKEGAPWECCPRTFLSDALEKLRKEYGLTLKATFEHEFSITHENLIPTEATYTFAAYRQTAPIIHNIVAALQEARLPPHAVEPEFGSAQLEISFSPSDGLTGADETVLVREIVRDIAAQHGALATYAPKPAPTSVGNGMHIHFSLWNAETDAPVSYDPKGRHELSSEAACFVAGIVRHAKALCAVTAPSPLSYTRLQPHSWSCAYKSFGVQNRECAVRVCPPYAKDPEGRAKAFNFEYRIADGTCNPYLALGMIVSAGLEGLKRKADLPKAADKDPADMSAAEREACDIEQLPSSLEEALDAFLKDDSAAGWMPAALRDAFVAVKQTELQSVKDLNDDDLCAKYAAVY